MTVVVEETHGKEKDYGQSTAKGSSQPSKASRWLFSTKGGGQKLETISQVVEMVEYGPA